MSLAGLITEGVFQVAGLIPGELRGEIATVHLGWNYTTALNVLALLAFGYLYYLYKNADRYGGGTDYAKDPICGMQVRKADAPARTTHAGTAYWFCSDKCLHKFESAPDKYASGAPTEPMESDGSARDPVCGMTVDVTAPGAIAEVAGTTYYFCCQGCADAFVGDPDRYLSTSAEGR
jgi:YHS domain-containing protein